MRQLTATATNWHDGQINKSLSSPFAQKYFRFPVGQIRSLTPAVLSHQALAIVANEGQGAVDAKAATDERGICVR